MRREERGGKDQRRAETEQCRIIWIGQIIKEKPLFLGKVRCLPESFHGLTGIIGIFPGEETGILIMYGSPRSCFSRPGWQR